MCVCASSSLFELLLGCSICITPFATSYGLIKLTLETNSKLIGLVYLLLTVP